MKEQKTFEFGKDEWENAQAAVAKQTFTRACEPEDDGPLHDRNIFGLARIYSRGNEVVISTPQDMVAAQAISTALDTCFREQNILSVEVAKAPLTIEFPGRHVPRWYSVTVTVRM